MIIPRSKPPGEYFAATSNRTGGNYNSECLGTCGILRASEPLRIDSKVFVRNGLRGKYLEPAGFKPPERRFETCHIYTNDAAYDPTK